ncbi:MAG TPA: GNAT family N-acetyltransferase [Micromonosporaceae bacterium]
MTGIEIRTYAPDDADAVAAVRSAVTSTDGESWMPGPDQRPGEPPSAALVATVGETVVGYTHAISWDEHDGTSLYLILGWIHPDHRRRGYGDTLIAAQEEAVRWALKAQPATGRPVFGANAETPGGVAFVKRHGFAYVFSMVDQVMDLSTMPEPIAFPAGVEERPVTADHHRAIFDVIVECFDDHAHGYVTATWDEYREECLDEDTGPWSVAWAGDEIAGLVISTVDGDGVADTPWVAVRRPWRRRGLAQAMLRSSQCSLYANGVRTAGIRTTLENENDTVGLYERLGYRVTSRHPRYRKPVS